MINMDIAKESYMSINGFPYQNHSVNMRGTESTNDSIIYPRMKHTFLVQFELAPNALANRLTNINRFINDGSIYTTLKSIDIPKMQFKTEKLNAYNKKVIIKTGTEYSTTSMTFHDDNTSMVMSLWKEYRAFYQYEGQLSGDRLSDYKNDNLIGGSRSSQSRLPSLGNTLRNSSERTFFDSIVIYDLGSEPDSVNIYKYIFPVITGIDHSVLSYDDPTPSDVTFTLDYESYSSEMGQNIFDHRSILNHVLKSDTKYSPKRKYSHSKDN